MEADGIVFIITLIVLVALSPKIIKYAIKSLLFKKSNTYRKYGFSQNESQEERRKREEAQKTAGDNYEELVANIYRKRGYEVIENGKEKGLLDEGIDLIAVKKNQYGQTNYTLIQCKYWKEPYSIRHYHIKEFFGNCYFYINKRNMKLKDCNFIYVIPKYNTMHQSAISTIVSNAKTSKLRYEIIEKYR